MGKKIAFLYSPTESGDEKTHILSLADQLRRAGNEVDLYDDLSSACKSTRKLIKTFRKNRPSIVHLHGEKACLIGAAVCRRLKLPLAITVYEEPRQLKTLKRFCIDGNYVFAANETIKNRLIDQHICNSKRIFITARTDDATLENVQKVYRANINVVRPLDYMVSGYYGRNNFGDNLTLNRLMDHLKNYRGTVLTCDKGYTDVPPRVKMVHRFDLFTIRRLMKKTKVFLFGSGSILQDATSNRSIFYYYFIMKMALHYNCKTMLYANGIGPISNPKNRKSIARILEKIDLVTIRDRDSIELMQQLKPGRPAYLTQDDAFSYDVSAVSPLPLENDIGEKTVVGVNFKLGPQDETRIVEIAGALDTLAKEHQLYYLLIPYHLSQDLEPLRKLHELLPKITELSTATYDPDMLIRYAACCKFQIVERLHGQIVASMLGQPFLPINYDPKTKAFAAQTQMTPYLMDHEQLSQNTLIEKFNTVIQNQSVIEEKLKAFYKKAVEDAALNRKHLYQIIQDF